MVTSPRPGVGMPGGGDLRPTVYSMWTAGAQVMASSVSDNDAVVTSKGLDLCDMGSSLRTAPGTVTPSDRRSSERFESHGPAYR